MSDLDAESGHDPELFAELMRAERAATPISGKAIAALVFGLLVGLAAFAVWAVLGTLWLTGSWGKNATELAAHDCFTTSPRTVVPCDEPHDREVVSVAEGYTPERCPAQARAYLDPARNYPDLRAHGAEHGFETRTRTRRPVHRGTTAVPCRDFGLRQAIPAQCGPLGHS